MNSHANAETDFKERRLTGLLERGRRPLSTIAVGPAFR